MINKLQQQLRDAKLKKIKASFLFGERQRPPEKKRKHWGNVYVLELENGCFYTGWTIDLTRRLKKHLFGQGATWTKLHTPVRLVATFENAPLSMEDEVTERYLLKYGYEKVRGGRYIALRQPDS